MNSMERKILWKTDMSMIYAGWACIYALGNEDIALMCFIDSSVLSAL
jgi:hypothetical protein